MKILKFITTLCLLALVNTSCSKKEWTEQQKLTLDLQSMAVGSFVSSKCFETYILSNYSGEEYLKGGESIPKEAIAKCSR